MQLIVIMLSRVLHVSSCVKDFMCHSISYINISIMTYSPILAILDDYQIQTYLINPISTLTRCSLQCKRDLIHELLSDLSILISFVAFRSQSKTVRTSPRKGALIRHLKPDERNADSLFMISFTTFPLHRINYVLLHLRRLLERFLRIRCVCDAKIILFSIPPPRLLVVS